MKSLYDTFAIILSKKPQNTQTKTQPTGVFCRGGQVQYFAI